MLSFTSVYFFESRLFNGLRPIQIKKSSSISSVRKNLRLSSLISAPDWLPLRFRHSPSIVVISDFCNKFSENRVFLTRDLCLASPRRAAAASSACLIRDAVLANRGTSESGGAMQLPVLLDLDRQMRQSGKGRQPVPVIALPACVARYDGDNRAEMARPQPPKMKVGNLITFPLNGRAHLVGDPVIRRHVEEDGSSVADQTIGPTGDHAGPYDAR